MFCPFKCIINLTEEMATKKTKKKKLDPIPKINRRLFRLWSEAVRENAGHQCEYCHIKRGDINENGKKTKIDSHHFYSRDIKNCPLKWDIRNGIAVCPTHHKFSGDFSAHRTSIIFYEWIRTNYPDNYKFVIDNYTIRVDLHSREILAAIENHLKNKEPLDLEKLLKIDADVQTKKAEKTLDKGSLFDDTNEDTDLLNL